MKLLTKEVKNKIPTLYSSLVEDDPLCVVKFFTPDSNWTWYVIEGEKKEDGDWFFYGYVVGYDIELGYFTLNEIKKVRGVLNLPVERDMYFSPKPLSEIKKYEMGLL